MNEWLFIHLSNIRRIVNVLSRQLVIYLFLLIRQHPETICEDIGTREYGEPSHLFGLLEEIHQLLSGVEL